MGLSESVFQQLRAQCELQDVNAGRLWQFACAVLAMRGPRLEAGLLKVREYVLDHANDDIVAPLTDLIDVALGYEPAAAAQAQTTMQPEGWPESAEMEACSGDDTCPMCSGSWCELCGGPGPYATPCEHDSFDRHLKQTPQSLNAGEKQ